MVAAYLRFSTLKQEELQQKFSLEEYAKTQGLIIDQVIKDEGISGGVSYKNRHLNDLVKNLRLRAEQMKAKKIPQEKDVLLVTELSRLGRAMGDISALLNELKSIGIRLVIIKSGIDVDCSNLRPTDEFIFSAMAFAAQVEKDLIVQRTQSALDARKELIKKDGGFVSKSGNFVTHLGSQKGADMTPAHDVAAANKRAAAREWRKTSALFALVKRLTKRGWTNGEILEECLAMYEVNPTVYCTRQGKAPSSGTISKMMSEILPMKIRRRHGSCKER